MNKENDIALLDRYIRNECSEYEVVEIQKRLKTDNAFAAEYETLQGLAAGSRLDDLDSKMQLLQGFEKKIGTSNASESGALETATIENAAPPKVRKINLRYPAAAVAIMLLSLFTYYYLTDNKLYDFEDFHEYVMHENTRSLNAAEFKSDQQIAFNKYLIQDFHGAIPLLKRLWKKDEDELAGYYLGISYWVIGKKRMAREILELEQFKDYKKPY